MADDSIWGTAAYLVPRLSSSTRISTTAFGDALSILFDDAAVMLDKKLDGLDGSWTAGLAFNAKPGASTKFQCQLRGFVQKSSGARAAVTTTLGGRIFTRDYPYGSVAEEEFTVDAELDLADLAAGRVVILISVAAERQTFDDRVSVGLDSVDAFKIAPAAAKESEAKSRS
jgi:hypothetical protein